jgi:hypothetical protein
MSDVERAKGTAAEHTYHVQAFLQIILREVFETALQNSHTLRHSLERFDLHTNREEKQGEVQSKRGPQINTTQLTSGVTNPSE